MLDKIEILLVLRLHQLDQNEGNVAPMVLKVNVHVLAKTLADGLLNLAIALDKALDLDLLLSELSESLSLRTDTLDH